jgi:hypothetical protein
MKLNSKLNEFPKKKKKLVQKFMRDIFSLSPTNFIWNNKMQRNAGEISDCAMRLHCDKLHNYTFVSAINTHIKIDEVCMQNVKECVWNGLHMYYIVVYFSTHVTIAPVKITFWFCA